MRQAATAMSLVPLRVPAYSPLLSLLFFLHHRGGQGVMGDWSGCRQPSQVITTTQKKKWSWTDNTRTFNEKAERGVHAKHVPNEQTNKQKTTTARSALL